MPADAAKPFAQLRNVKTFGAVGDGVANDKSAITAAFAASRHVLFPAGIYNVGNITNAELIFGAIDGGGGPITIATDGLVKLVCNSVGVVNPTFFRIINAVGVSAGHISIEDTGGNPATASGAKGFSFSALGAKPLKHIYVDSVRANGLLTAVECVGIAGAARVSGVRIGIIEAHNGTYGLNCQNNGDDLKVDLIRTDSVYRSYFVYGVKNHDVSVSSVNNRLGSSGDINISAYSDGLDTENLNIKYMARNTYNTKALVSLIAIGEGSRRFRNIRLDLDIDSSTTGYVVQSHAYVSPGGAENMGATNNVWERIELRGKIVAPSAINHFDIRCQPSKKGLLIVSPSISQARISKNARTYFSHSSI